MTMKKSMRLLACGAVAALGLGLAQAASAADLPMKAPVIPAMPAAAFSWTGFYLGANGGAGFGTVSSSVDLGQFGIPGTVPIASHNVNGFVAGGQAGYNYQMGSFVVGVEGDFDWADINGDAPCVLLATCSAKVKWTADATARLGVAVDHALLYVKGGAAWANTEYSANVSLLGFTAGGSATTTRTGGLFGAGVEYAFARNWSAKIEYNYMDFGKDTVGIPLSALGFTANVNADIDQQIHVVKAGLNYRF